MHGLFGCCLALWVRIPQSDATTATTQRSRRLFCPSPTRSPRGSLGAHSLIPLSLPSSSRAHIEYLCFPVCYTDLRGGRGGQPTPLAAWPSLGNLSGKVDFTR